MRTLSFLTSDVIDDAVGVAALRNAAHAIPEIPFQGGTRRNQQAAGSLGRFCVRQV